MFGICTVLIASIKFSVDCSLWSDTSVSGFKVLAMCLDSWYVGDPRNETMGLIGVCGLWSLGSPNVLVTAVQNT